MITDCVAFTYYCLILFSISKRAKNILLLFKKVGSARLRESDVHPISPRTPAPQYQPLDVVIYNVTMMRPLKCELVDDI